MLENGDEGSSPSKMFHGVRFVLLGFNSAEEEEEEEEEAMIRSKLVNGGGFSLNEYGPSCTHVIVDKIVYDDSRCVTARSDGKTVVTALWVDHSFDIGMPVDTSAIIYRPVKDLNGIPGAKSFCICLTGYLRQDREDIMRMVGLMGAHFSKPLVANKVTHLICYKFEGEKYELAKKMKRIKLVNHRWLEDCLKAWEILPEYDYDKSGHEIEIMEAEAKDSEDETEDRSTNQIEVGSVAESPKWQSGHGTSVSKVSAMPMTREVSEVQNAAAVKGLIVTEDVVSGKRLSINGGNARSDNATALCDVNKNDLQNGLGTGAYCGKPISSGVSSSSDKTPKSSNGGEFPSDLVNGKRSFHSDATNASTLSYSRKMPKISPVSMLSPEGHLEEHKKSSLPLKSIQAKTLDFWQVQDPMTHAESHGAHVKDGMLPQKRTLTLSGTTSRSPKRGSPSSINYDTGSTSASVKAEGDMISAPQMKTPPSLSRVNHPLYEGILNSVENQSAKLSKPHPSNANTKPLKCGLPVSRTMISDTDGSPSGVKMLDTKTLTPETLWSEPRLTNLAAAADVGDFRLKRTTDQDSFSNTRNSVPERLRSTATLGIHNVNKDKTSSRSGTKKSVNKDKTSSRSGTKKSLDSRSKHSSSITKDQKQSPSWASTVTPNKATFSFDEGKHENVSCAETEIAGPALKADVFAEQKADVVPGLATVIENKIVSMDDETEAPQEENCEKSVNEEVAEPTSKEDIVIVANLETMQHSGNEIKGDSSRMGDESVVSEEDGTDLGKTTCVQKTEVERLSCKADQVEEMINEGKCPSSMTKENSLFTMKGAETSVKDKDGVEVDKRINGEKLELDKEMINEGKCPSSMTKKNSLFTMKGAETSVKDKDGVEVDKRINDEKLDLDKTEMLHPVGKPKEIVSVKEADKLMDVEENKMPIGNEDPSVNLGKYFRKKVPTKKHRKGMQNKKVAGGTVPDGMLVNGGTCPSNENEKNGPSAMKEIETCEEGKGVEIEKKMGGEKMRVEKAKGLLYPSKTKSMTLSSHKTENPMDVNKENKPMTDERPSVNSGKHGKNKVSVKSKRTLMQINSVAGSKGMEGGRNLDCVRPDPVWFILSGHRLQRKEFQQVIRRLKGKFCRDSHHWSYQATHFVVPDPLRRTEKFFAAAASGRWILKTDYLTASSQAGKFLAEEPYEWFKNGLSEDGSINLEAPRKWRLLRERTGHGAFYGMRIIIYGECIAPSLDTLKRVVKAGDGTILATSPPYTRFLKSGIDFAIVSSGMPRVDLWVQEFLRHEIPCIMADYLVEYVCKPGFSLDKHVLYNTIAWAEKSFANLLTRSDEIVEASTLSDADDRVDLTCQVCGSRDRGDIMLICGDEKGSVGCGIGTHIDCCNPPLEAVPEEDWFCPECSKG